MRFRTVLPLLFAAFLFAATEARADAAAAEPTPARKAEPKEPTPQEKEREFLSPAMLAELRSAKRFKAYRIGDDYPLPKEKDDNALFSSPKWPRPEPPDFFQWRKVVSTVSVEDPKAVHALTDLLADRKSYDFTDVYQVAEHTSFGVRLETARGPLDVQFDFDFNGITICTNPPGEGIWVGASMLPARPKLVALVKSLFPNDALARDLTPEPDRIRRRLGAAAEVLAKPDRVEYLRLGGKPPAAGEDDDEARGQPAKGPNEPTLLRYRVVGKGRPHDPKLSAALGAVLTDEKTYGNGIFFCFSPGVGYRFVKGDRSVAVLVCLDCLQVAIANELKGDKLDDLIGPVIVTPEAYDKLLALSKQAFPDDPGMQNFEPPFRKK